MKVDLLKRVGAALLAGVLTFLLLYSRESALLLFPFISNSSKLYKNSYSRSLYPIGTSALFEVKPSDTLLKLYKLS